MATFPTLGQRVADRVASWVGSWAFIGAQSALLGLWILVNLLLGVHAWDPYPFICLNLLLSFQAAYTGPVVLMATNRQAEQDRLHARLDFETNERTEAHVKELLEHLQTLEREVRLLRDQVAELRPRKYDRRKRCPDVSNGPTSTRP